MARHYLLLQVFSFEEISPNIVIATRKYFTNLFKCNCNGFEVYSKTGKFPIILQNHRNMKELLFLKIGRFLMPISWYCGCSEGSVGE